MTQPFLLRIGLLCTIIFAWTAVTVVGQIKPGRDPRQPIDEQYTGKIREYTTQPFFNSPLTDYLPASPNVPTPKSVLGDVAGAPGQVALCSGSLSLHAHARARKSARKSFLHRHDRGRSRDDRGGCRV